MVIAIWLRFEYKSLEIEGTFGRYSLVTS
jgi:hypothetical protein